MQLIHLQDVKRSQSSLIVCVPEAVDEGDGFLCSLQASVRSRLLFQ